MDWDDLRFYLAVARHGSIRGASSYLSVNPSTVARRIDAFEKKIGVRLFERLPTGYELTNAGIDMIASAELIENEVASLGRRVTGRDAQLNGSLRITLPAPLASHLLIEDIAEFEKIYPGIQLEMHLSFEELNLSKREADVAIRVTNSPIDYLVGKKVANFSFAIYAAKHYLAKHDIKNHPEKLQWISYNRATDNIDWIAKSHFANAPVRHIINDPTVIFEATKAGMGIARLPCFIADSEPALIRISDTVTQNCGDIWLLTHKDLRNTARVRVFIEFMTKAFEKHQDCLIGNKKTVYPPIWYINNQPA